MSLLKDKAKFEHFKFKEKIKLISRVKRLKIRNHTVFNTIVRSIIKFNNKYNKLSTDFNLIIEKMFIDLTTHLNIEFNT